MTKTVEELNDAYLRIERQLSELSSEMKIMTSSLTQLSESVKSITELMKQQIELSSELNHLKKDFESHEKTSEKILIKIDKDLDALHAKYRDSEKRLHSLELELHDNTTARKIGQWAAGLIIAAVITVITWKLK